jgi:plasmid stability protein
MVVEIAKLADSIAIRMAQLLVRGLDEDLVRRLKLRAAENGFSAEEEHRRILREALTGDSDRFFYEHLLAMPDVGDDSDFERSTEYPRDVEL